MRTSPGRSDLKAIPRSYDRRLTNKEASKTAAPVVGGWVSFSLDATEWLRAGPDCWEQEPGAVGDISSAKGFDAEVLDDSPGGHHPQPQLKES